MTPAEMEEIRQLIAFGRETEARREADYARKAEAARERYEQLKVENDRRKFADWVNGASGSQILDMADYVMAHGERAEEPEREISPIDRMSSEQFAKLVAAGLSGHPLDMGAGLHETDMTQVGNHLLGRDPEPDTNPDADDGSWADFESDNNEATE